MSVDSGDAALIRIVDAALAEAARRSRDWLVCRPGCTQCCLGPFPINQLDVRRLRLGLAALDVSDPERALRVRERARVSLDRLGADYVVEENDEHDDEPCPALDPATGLCDVYAARPPVRCGDQAVGVCELCYEGASEAEIAACEVEIDPEGLEEELVAELEAASGETGTTIVARVLAG